MDDARAHARNLTDWKKARKAELAAHRRLTVGDVADAVAAVPLVTPAAPVQATVIRPLFDAPRAPVAAPLRPDEVGVQQAVIADLTARLAAKVVVDDGGRDTYRRARDLERQSAAGASLTKDQQVWLAGYQTTPAGRHGLPIPCCAAPIGQDWWVPCRRMSLLR